MGQVTVLVNGRPYPVGCEDGQEKHVEQLAALFDEQVRQVASEVGNLAETRLFLMGALLLADEIAEARDELERARTELSRARADRSGGEMRAIRALEQAAKAVEALTAKAD